MESGKWKYVKGRGGRAMRGAEDWRWGTAGLTSVIQLSWDKKSEPGPSKEKKESCEDQAEIHERKAEIIRETRKEKLMDLRKTDKGQGTNASHNINSENRTTPADPTSIKGGKPR